MKENLDHDDGPPRVTPEMVEDWLRHAQLRAANLYYLAGDPSPSHRDRALAEMSKALREALEELRVVAEQMRHDSEVERSKPRRESLSRHEQPVTPSPPLRED